jgi:hypothetical protein
LRLDSQPLLGGKLEGDTHDLRRDAAAAKRSRYFRVRENHPLSVAFVGGKRKLAIDLRLETVSGNVMVNDKGRGFGAHGQYSPLHPPLLPYDCFGKPVSLAQRKEKTGPHEMMEGVD